MADQSDILLCLSPAPSNPRVIRAAAGMRGGEDTRLIALFVETPGYAGLTSQEKERLQEHMSLAESLGARIEVISGDDVPFQIAEYARLTGCRRVVLGRSETSSGLLLPRRDLSGSLQRLLPEAEVHVIPDGSRGSHYRASEPEPFSLPQIGRDLAVSLGLLAAASVLGALFDSLGFTGSTVMMAYLLGVLLTAILTSHRGYSLAAAVGSVFLFNYFFVQPRFTLNAYEPGYPVTFVVMFLTAFVTGTLAVRLKRNARQAAQTARRTGIISDTDRMLAKAASREEVLEVCSRQVGKLLEQPFRLLETEGGPTPEGFRDFPLQVQDRSYGLLRLDLREKPLEVAEHGILLSVLGECALALENQRNAREKEEAAVQVENERLRSTLLRAVSHDLRTPLTAITGQASNLLAHGESLDAQTRQAIYSDIYEDSLWLGGMVENLLASTRLEQGEAELRLEPELIEDIIDEALRHTGPARREHSVIAEPVEELLLVKADARLLVQVIVNLVDNAAKYTPPGSEIRVSARREGGFVRVDVADNGPGVPPEEQDRIFDMFYVGSNSLPDGRRSLGFGLALCKTILTHHGGTISVENRQPHGAVFSFRLPAEEVSYHG